MSDIGAALQDFGGAVSDLYAAGGSKASAASYGQAAVIASQNAELAAEATAIKETQTQRQIYQTIGAQEAQVAGAGMLESGSALDILRSSQSQGALTKAITAEQGAIEENAYAEQAGMYAGMQKAANATSQAQTAGGILQAAGGLVNVVSGAGSWLGSGTLSSIVGSSASSGAVDAAIATGTASSLSTGTAAAGLGTGTSVAGLDVSGAAIGSGAGDAAGAIGGAAAGAAAADIGGGAIAATAGDSFLGDLVGVAAAWVVCTELNRQGRLPTRWYVPGARRFARYGETEKRGYYFWAIPAVRHLRAHPSSLASNFLEWMFNHRAEYIAAQAGLKGARKTLPGWLTLAGAFAVSWLLGATVARKPQDWSVLYRERSV